MQQFPLAKMTCYVFTFPMDEFHLTNECYEYHIRIFYTVHTLLYNTKYAGAR
jgi:hypothetical protein